MKPCIHSRNADRLDDVIRCPYSFLRDGNSGYASIRNGDLKIDTEVFCGGHMVYPEGYTGKKIEFTCVMDVKGDTRKKRVILSDWI